MAKSYTATEAARLLNVSDKTVRSWLKAGRFPGARVVRLKGLRQWAIPETALQQVIQEERGASPGNTGEIPEIKAAIADICAELVEIRRAIAVLSLATHTEIPVDTVSISEKPAELHKVLHKTNGPARRARSVVSDLPAGYIAISDFAHGIPETSRLRYAKDGGAQVGKWRDPRGYIARYALDPGQQSAYYMAFKDHAYFQPCQDCPHDAPGLENTR